MKLLKTLFRRLTRTPLLPLVALAAGLLFVPDLALAAATATEESRTATQVIQEMVTMLNVFFQFLQFLLYPLLLVIAALMDNEMLIGPAMENKLRLIWVEIRNWVNMAFVLIMVGIAFYNVMGIAGDGSNYALKSILPKIVIGLVAVNFSFLAGKLLIDSTAVLTNAVYALPQSSKLVDWDKQRDEMRVRLCEKPGEVGGSISYESEDAQPRAVEDGSILGLVFCAKDESEENFTGEFNTFGNNFFNHFGQHNVSVALMVQMGNATDIPVPKDAGLNSLSDLTFNLLFGVFLFVMFGFAYVALAVVLIARVVVLWICLALSPLAVLVFVFPDLGQAAGGGNFDIKEKFFGHLFVPLIIGVVFSIGFTMLATLKDTSAGGWLGQIGEKSLADVTKTEDVIELADTYGKDLSDFQDLLIAAAAVIIIWMGTFAAAEKTVASSITNTIKSAGESTGKFLAKLPAYATAIPVKLPGSDEKTPLNLMNILGTIGGLPRAFEQKQRDKTQELIRGITSDALGSKLDQLNKDMRNLSSTSAQTEFNNFIRDPKNLDRPGELKKAAIELARKVNPDLVPEIEKVKDDDFVDWLKAGGSEAKDLLGSEYNPSMVGASATPPQATSPATTPPAVTTAVQTLNPSGRPPMNGPLTGQAQRDVKTALDSLSDVQVGVTANLVDGNVAQSTLDAYKALSDAQRTAVLKATTVTNGKIDGASFTQAVTDVTVGAPAGGTAAGGGTGTTGTGGTAAGSTGGSSGATPVTPAGPPTPAPPPAAPAPAPAAPVAPPPPPPAGP